MTLLTLFASATGTLGAPDVSILAATNVKAFTATIRGQIDNNHGYDVTEIGFEWGEVSGTYEHSVSLSDDSPYTGINGYGITSLNEGDTYYYRFYATNSQGTTYSPEYSLTTIDSTYILTIDGTDRTGDILAGTLSVEDVINDQQNTCSFSLIDRSGNGIPSTDEEVTITMLDGTKLFGGYIVTTNLSKLEQGTVQCDVECVDYSRLLDSILVHKSYENQTDKTIIEDVIDTYLQGYGISTNNVLEGATIDQISFNYKQPSQVFRRIAELASRFWYIDYDKDIHYFPLTTNAAPFNIDSSSAGYFNLEISKDATQLKNRVYVRGGTKLSDFTTYAEVGDGEKKKFVLPDKPHNVTLTVNDVEETVGIKNVDTDGFDWYLNFQEKYVEQDAGGSVLTSSDTLEITYKYDIPILVALEDTDSILESGVKEFAIFDTSISTTEAARDRAAAELTDYANSLIEGSFETYEPGFRSGQYININLTEYGVNDDYVVQRVRARSLGAGHYSYEVSIASAKTLGIIRFLIDLLEADRNAITLSDDEVVDELFTITDSLLDDSLVEDLTIDSQGALFTWCTDSLQDSPQTRAVWDLFSWG